MKKKNIVSLFLAGSLLGGFAVTFTGCIDNDEPEGIKVLREAKAGLLSAKEAVAAAEAAKLQAEAQKALADAELTKAQAEINKLLAEAEAAKIKAETEAAAAKSQAEVDAIRAAAEAEAEKTALEIEKIKAETQQAIAAAEAAIEQTELNNEYAKLALKKALLEFDNGTKQWYLQAYYQRYLDAQDEYTEAYKDYVRTQADYLSALGDTKISVYKAEKDLNDKISKKQQALDEMNKNIEKTKAEIELAATLEPDQLYERRDSLKATLNDLDNQIANVALELAQAQYDNKDLYDKAQELKDAYKATVETKVTIDPFTYTFPDLNIVSGYTGEFTVNDYGENGYFTVDSLGNASEYYQYALDNLTFYQQQVKKSLLDDNDLVWNDALIEEKTRALEGLKETNEQNKALWQEAVDFYNGGKGYDITKLTLSGYNELKEAIDSYNALVAPANTAKQALAAAKAAESAATDKVNALDPDNVFTEIINTLDEAKSAAWTKYYDTVIEARNVRTATKDAEEDALRNAKNNEKVLLDLYNSASYKYYADESEANQKAMETAEKAWQDAVAASEYADSIRNDYTVVDSIYSVSWYAAASVYYNDIAAADKAYAKAVEGGYTAFSAAQQKAIEELSAAIEATSEAINAYEGYNDESGNFVPGAGTLLDTAYLGVTEAANNLIANTGGSWYIERIDYYREDVEDNYWWGTSTVYWYLYEQYQGLLSFSDTSREEEDEDGNSAFIELDVNTLLTSSDENAKTLIERRSDEVYGSIYYDLRNDSNYDLPYTQLIELTQEDIDNILRTYYTSQDYRLYQYYPNFGSFGNILYQEALINIMKARKDNPTIVAEVSAQFDEAIAALQQSKEDQYALIVDALDAYTVQQLAVDEFEKSFTDKKNDLTGDKAAVNRIYNALLTVLGKEDTDAHLSASSIAAYQKALKEDLASYEEQIPELEDALAEAQKTLEGWQAGQIILADAYKALLDIDAENLAIKKETVDLAKAALDGAIAYLESL